MAKRSSSESDGGKRVLYRETGQFKTSYAADSVIFPIRQDQIGVMIVLAIRLHRHAR